MIDISLYDMKITRAPSYLGLRIIRDIHMTETVEDWSRVRSPSRARRRRRLGYRQNIDYRVVPKKEAVSIGDALVMHPETADALDRLMKEQAEKIHDRMLKEACGIGESASMMRESGGALTMEHIERARRLLW